MRAIWLGLVCVCSLLANDKPNVIFIFAGGLGYGDWAATAILMPRRLRWISLPKRNALYTGVCHGRDLLPESNQGDDRSSSGSVCEIMADHGFGNSVTITELLKATAIALGISANGTSGRIQAGHVWH